MDLPQARIYRELDDWAKAYPIAWPPAGFEIRFQVLLQLPFTVPQVFGTPW